MGFLSTLECLSDECSRHGAWYRTATQDDPVLGEHDSPARLTRALALDSPLCEAQRVEIIEAIVRAEHASAHPIWQAILLHALSGALCRLRSPASAFCGHDPQIVERFVGAVRRVGRVGDASRIAFHLRELASRTSFRLSRRKLWEELAAPDQDPLAVPYSGSGVTLEIRPPAHPALRVLLRAVERAAVRALLRVRHPCASAPEIERRYRHQMRRPLRET